MKTALAVFAFIPIAAIFWPFRSLIKDKEAKRMLEIILYCCFAFQLAAFIFLVTLE